MYNIKYENIQFDFLFICLFIFIAFLSTGYLQP
jgi:hypothetical protein